MSQSEKELGITVALLERFEHETLPEGLWLKERVDKGELLSDTDMEFLARVLENAQMVKSMIDHQPEWQPLYASAIHLYEEIIAKGLENQQAAEKNKTV